MYRIDELLLIEHLTYMPDKSPLISILDAEGMKVGEYLDKIDLDAIDLEYVYATQMNGFDFKNIILALKKNPSIANATIIDTHLDTAFGAGGGISIVLLSDESVTDEKGRREAVVAFRGTAELEWTDDFEGANKIDSLQQINALEWYKQAYSFLDLDQYFVTVTGHSKGGNKAKYITILNDTPDRCVSFDGQGFSDKFFEQYKRDIIKRQSVIENHNIDFDYVNILMNDIGSKTYYIGYDYGKAGFSESHAPNTFFDFGENGEYQIRVNPNGQRPEMQIVDQFVNSLIRSAISEKESNETNYLVGMLVEKAFALSNGGDISEFINYLCDMIGDPKYSDNVAYLLAYSILYSKKNPNLLEAFRSIMTAFHSEDILKIIDMIDEILNSKKLGALLEIADFLVGHVSKPIIRKVQSIAKKKYDVELKPEQVASILQIATLTRQMIDTLDLNMDGSDIELKNIDLSEDDLREFVLPGNLNIVVLAGGLSNERNLSLKTGVTVAEVLRSRGNNVILLDAFMGYGSEEELLPDVFDNPVKYSLEAKNIPDEIPDLWATKKRRPDQSESYFGPNVIQICRQSDLVFIALHGANGENGKVQATFDLLGLDYTGCDYFSSAISSNKIAAKQLMKTVGVPVPDGYTIKKGDTIPDPKELGFEYPVIVKPNNGGIGVGVSVASDINAYHKAIANAFRWDSEIMIEAYWSGREFAVCTVEGKALPVLEKLPFETSDKEKGLSMKGETVNKCPAEIPEELAAELQRAAENVACVLGTNAYAKMDFIASPDLKSFVCLECDSLPQLYPDSHLVISAKAAGRSQGDLLDKIMEMALIRKVNSR
ncbi:MAG: DUF2974 domain-containing protein [Lachnospiraceae bacterium]|nr:DUF2974 domain-containing protein [Lachnospiraceae bacterium]